MPVAICGHIAHCLGGYDTRVDENIDCLTELEKLCDKYELTHHTIWPQERKVFKAKDAQVYFMPSIPEYLRNNLLKKSLCLVYTPADEHFGIVPIEAMACSTPVIAMNSGGPCETIVNNVTGFLCDPTPESVGEKLEDLLLERVNRDSMGSKAKDHVMTHFSLEHFGDQLEGYLLELCQK